MNRLNNLHQKQTGFTLAEMLIALVLVGIIATIMVPKVLFGTGEKERIAKFKSTISTIVTMDQNGVNAGQINDAASWLAYMKSATYYQKACDDATANGCINTGVQLNNFFNNTAAVNNSPGYIMKDGQQIVVQTSTTCLPSNGHVAFNIFIDANGDKAPNKCSATDCGNDQLAFVFNSQASKLTCAGVLPGRFGSPSPAVTGPTSWSASLLNKAF